MDFYIYERKKKEVNQLRWGNSLFSNYWIRSQDAEVASVQINKQFPGAFMRWRNLSIKKCIFITLICILGQIFSTFLLNYTFRDINPRPLKSLARPGFFNQWNDYLRLAKAQFNDSHSRLYQDPLNDRIFNQLMYVPPNYEEIRRSGQLKIIYVHRNQMEEVGPKAVLGRDVFLEDHCPVDTCTITNSFLKLNNADMILNKEMNLPIYIGKFAKPKLVTMMWFEETPFHRQKHFRGPYTVNWTSSYSWDSEIVSPYGKWVYYNSSIRQQKQHRNYATNKTKKVAWFVTQCNTTNDRFAYAAELSAHIQVDIYGPCGNYKCNKEDKNCFNVLDRDYKFYLAFENSNCRNYITEKLFNNAFLHNVLPIVMGAPPEDYERSAPERSYIHVDEFSSVSELADYLHTLDKDDQLYNTFFKWKGTGEFVNIKFWCRVCAALHNEELLNKPRWYTYSNWSTGSDACTTGSWRKFRRPGMSTHGNL